MPEEVCMTCGAVVGKGCGADEQIGLPDPIPMTDEEWKPFAKAIGLEEEVSKPLSATDVIDTLEAMLYTEDFLGVERQALEQALHLYKLFGMVVNHTREQLQSDPPKEG